MLPIDFTPLPGATTEPGTPRTIGTLTPDEVRELFQAAYWEPPRPDALITIGPRAVSIRERGRLCLYVQSNGLTEAYYDESRKPVAELDTLALVAAFARLQIQFIQH